MWFASEKALHVKYIKTLTFEHQIWKTEEDDNDFGGGYWFPFLHSRHLKQQSIDVYTFAISTKLDMKDVVSNCRLLYQIPLIVNRSINQSFQNALTQLKLVFGFSSHSCLSFLCGFVSLYLVCPSCAEDGTICRNCPLLCWSCFWWVRWILFFINQSANQSTKQSINQPIKQIKTHKRLKWTLFNQD